jgi:hypothetical protein
MIKWFVDTVKITILVRKQCWLNVYFNIKKYY